MTTQPVLEDLDVDTCLRLLAEQHVGRIAMNDDSGPVVVPVNYTLHEGAVVFRTDLGTKLTGAEQHVRVAFEIDHVDQRRRLGWSVVARGKLVEVTDPTDLDRLRQLPLAPFAPGDKAHYARVATQSITGRRIRIPDGFPDGWSQPLDLGNIIWFAGDGDDLAGLVRRRGTETTWRVAGARASSERDSITSTGPRTAGR